VGNRSIVLALVTALCVLGTAAEGRAELSDWAVQAGFSLEVDSTGFDLPTAIAFVPDGGDGPDDPLYFVAELRGDIKVVTNDRSVHRFATVPTTRMQETHLLGSSQQGLAGLCLDPGNGFVFATFTYPDASGILRNGIVRFASTPRTFGLAAAAEADLGGVLAPFQSAPAHQIGGCEVHADALFVGIGDGGNTSAVRDPDQLLGKVVCLTLEGRPCADDGSASAASDAVRPADAVWAHGFRNPFGLRFVGDRLYVAENGIDVDRFVAVRRGADHHWNGSDQSLALGAKVLFMPAVSPVQLDFLPADDERFPPAFRGRFFTSAFGGKRSTTGVISFGYDFEADELTSVPEYIVAYRGASPQHVIGAAFGPDGLYLAPSVPDKHGDTSILKLRYDPETAHPVVIGTATDPVAGGFGLLARHACVSCHAVDGQGGGIGPSLDQFGLEWRLTERLNAEAYAAQVAEVDRLDEEPFVAFRAARQEVLAAEGRERTRVWMRHFLLEPRFDNPSAQMPPPGLSAAEAEAIRDALIPAGAVPVDRLTRLVRSARRNRGAVALGFVGGAGFAAVLALMLAGGYGALRRARGG
jgi:glucose/arabinose dehydrogenase